MFKKKQSWDPVPFMFKELGIGDMQDRITALERQAEIAACKHDFRPNGFGSGPLFPHIPQVCDLCGYKTKLGWYKLTRKQQKAYKALELVPQNWPLKDKKCNTE